MPSARSYQPLPMDEEKSGRLSSTEAGPRSSRLALRFDEVVSPANIARLLGLLCLFLTAGLFVLLFERERTPRDVLSFSPAQDAIRYHTVIYPDAIHHKTKYMGAPSPDLDAAWEADYDLISRIPTWQAEHLDPTADELPDDPGYHAVMLDIFHSLHCLNEVRKSLNPEYYGPPSDRFNTTEERVKIHLDHCVEHIRLALWCNADISPIPFQKGGDGFTASHVYTHTCRDKDAILEWAMENRIQTDL